MKKMIGILLSAMLATSVFAEKVNSWAALTDANDKGSSTAELTVSDETIDGKKYEGVATLKGTVTTKFQYGYAGMYSVDGAPLEKLLQNGSGIELAVSGDGAMYDVRIETSDRKDYCYHKFTFQAPKGKVKKYTIPYSKLKQDSWGVPKKFDKSLIKNVSFQTIGQPIKSYELKVINVEVMP